MILSMTIFKSSTDESIERLTECSIYEIERMLLELQSESPEDRLIRHLVRSSVIEVEEALEVLATEKSRTDRKVAAILVTHKWTLKEWQKYKLSLLF